MRPILIPVRSIQISAIALCVLAGTSAARVSADPKCGDTGVTADLAVASPVKILLPEAIKIGGSGKLTVICQPAPAHAASDISIVTDHQALSVSALVQNPKDAELFTADVTSLLKTVGLYAIKVTYMGTTVTKNLAVEKVVYEKRGPGMLTGGGYLLAGKRNYDPDKKTYSMDFSQEDLIFHILKTYNDDNAGSGQANPDVSNSTSATAASFSWTNTLTSGTVLATDSAFRFDLRNKNDLEAGRFIPSFGAEFHHGGKGNGETFWQHYIFQTSTYMQFTDSRHAIVRGAELYMGPEYETGGDLANVSAATHLNPKATRLANQYVEEVAGLINIEPLLRIGNTTSGEWLLINGKTPQGKSTSTLQYYWLGRVGLELGHVNYKSPDATTVSSTFFRPQFEVGAKVGGVKLKYSLTQRNGLDGAHKDYLYGDLSATINLDPNGILALTAGYQHGKNAPAFTKTETFTLGLGVKL